MKTASQEQVEIDYASFNIFLENEKSFEGTFTARLLYWMEATYHNPAEGEVEVNFYIDHVYNFDGDKIDYTPTEEDKQRIYELLDSYVWENIEEYE